MNRTKILHYFSDFLKKIDWPLLIFLLLFLNVKLIIKIIAIVIIYLLRFNFKFQFRTKNPRLPLFYPILISTSLISWFLNKSYVDRNYNLVFIAGLVFWVLCILAIHQIKLAVERRDPSIIHTTLFLFFIINAIVTFLNISIIVWETGYINPFRYQGEYQKYFIGTGDYIKGASFDTSTTNAIINCFGLIYFLARKKAGMVLMCLGCLLLTVSNFTNLILVLIFVYLFLFKTNREQKSLIVASVMLIFIFWVKISPQNNQYLLETYRKLINDTSKSIAANGNPIPIIERPDSLLNDEEKKEKIATLYIDSLNHKYSETHKSLDLIAFQVKPEIPKINIHNPFYQRKIDTTEFQRVLLNFIQENKAYLPLSSQQVQIKKPGKIIAFKQTIGFFKTHPQKIIFGTGPGKFSSKLAFRATGLNIAGSFPSSYTYIDQQFKTNHLDLYLSFFSKKADFHSLTNTPDSVYDQLLSEYGIVGVLAFIFFYFGFFYRYHKKLTFGIAFLILLLSAFFTDYWFEQLSIIPLCELLLFLKIKESSLNRPDE